MAIVRHFGKPDIFITFTYNPRWPETTAAPNPGEQPHGWPNLSCRVFKQKYELWWKEFCYRRQQRYWKNTHNQLDPGVCALREDNCPGCSSVG